MEQLLSSLVEAKRECDAYLTAEISSGLSEDLQPEKKARLTSAKKQSTEDEDVEDTDDIES